MAYRKIPRKTSTGVTTKSISGQRQIYRNACTQYRQMAKLHLFQSNLGYDQISEILNTPNEHLKGLTPKEALNKYGPMPVACGQLWARRAYVIICKALSIKPLDVSPIGSKQETPVSFED